MSDEAIARRILREGSLNSNAAAKTEGSVIHDLMAHGTALEPLANADDPIGALADAVAAEMDWGFDELVADSGDDEDEAMDDLREGVEGELSSGFYFTGPLQVRRIVKVRDPADVVATGSAAEIGVSWSTTEIDDPDFVEQYGDFGATTSMVITATVRSEDVDWFKTLWKRLDPATFDYDEVVLRPDARPLVTGIAEIGGDAPKVR